jgi:hypothetical protein
MLTIDQRIKFFNNLSDPKWEPFYDEYKVHLSSLLTIIKDSNEALEGNIFHMQGTKEPDLNLAPYTLPKRRSLALLAAAHNNILEIGFNSGFSALLLLISNPKCKVTSFDIAHHKYTIPCFEYLKKIFANRLDLIVGDSRETVPIYLREENIPSAYIIDGGHGLSVAEADLCNIIDRAATGSIIAFDDTDMRTLRALINFYMLRGRVEAIVDPHGAFAHASQTYLIVR